jgi:hypothetical protein
LPRRCAKGGRRPTSLRRVQQRRMLPTRLTQRMQLLIQDRVIRRVLDSTARPALPFVARLLTWFPFPAPDPSRV